MSYAYTFLAGLCAGTAIAMAVKDHADTRKISPYAKQAAVLAVICFLVALTH